MSVCCIGGICIPYTAIVPLILLTLKWLGTKLVRFGLLPDVIITSLGLELDNNHKQQVSSSSCCTTCNDNSNNNDNNNDNNGGVTVVTTMDQWDTMVRTYDVVIVKFTATWCRPCQTIRSHYCQLSQKTFGRTVTDSGSNNSSSSNSSDHSSTVFFCEVDVDELTEVATTYKVSILPMFCILTDGGRVVKATMHGSNSQLLTDFVQTNIFVSLPKKKKLKVKFTDEKKGRRKETE